MPLILNLVEILISKNPGLKDRIASQTTLGRMGEASDIGPVVASLCSDEMGWVTGQCIGVCGSVL